MPIKSDQIEYEKRIRLVQEWILEEFPSGDIVANIFLKWQVEERQAKRYIAEARKRWVGEVQVLLDHKRRLKIEGLKKLKRSLQDKYKGTPLGIRAVLAVEREIIKLEGLQQPIKMEVTGANGTDLFNDKSDEELKELLKNTLSKIGE